MMTRFSTTTPAVVAGTEGYAEDAEWLIPRYEGVDFLEKYRAVAHLFPKEPNMILDVGAGTGADAGWLAQKGHQVVAVEPVAAFREAGRRLHPSPAIKWLDDSLPKLPKVLPPKKGFDLVLVSAVWNHLARAEREQAMTRFASLVAAGRQLILSIRYGPGPDNRRVFDVSVDETIQLAARHHFKTVVNVQTASVQLLNRQAGVTWSWLAFVRELPPRPRI
jgi:SAM-dependent methyltransferase